MKLIGSTSTTSFISFCFLNLFTIVDKFLWIFCDFLDLIKILYLKLFFILGIGATTGPKMLASSFLSNVFFKLIAKLSTFISFFPLNIIAINLSNGGSWFFLLISNSFSKNLSGSELVI